MIVFNLFILAERSFFNSLTFIITMFAVSAFKLTPSVTQTYRCCVSTIITYHRRKRSIIIIMSSTKTVSFSCWVYVCCALFIPHLLIQELKVSYVRDIDVPDICISTFSTALLVIIHILSLSSVCYGSV
jgi:hypothetical protein